MQKKIFLLLTLIFFVSCESVNNGLIGRYSIYDLKISEDQHLYFSYPDSAEIFLKNDEGVINYENCEVRFNRNVNSEKPQKQAVNLCASETEFSERKEDDVNYSAFFCENKLIKYEGILEKYPYVFSIEDDGKDVSTCVDVVELVASTARDYALYENEKFSFRIKLLAGFKVDYLSDQSGVVMKQWIENSEQNFEDPKFKEEVFPKNYVLEIGAIGKFNELQYPDINEFVKKEFEGYETKFYSSGIILDQSSNNIATSSYFIFSVDKKIIYEIYLRVPSGYYGKYQNLFKEIIDSLEIS